MRGRMKFLLLALTALMVAQASCHPALAQEDEPEAEVEIETSGAVVSDKPVDRPDDDEVQIVVTGTRTENLYKDSPVRVEVITRKDIEQKGCDNLYCVLQGIPSITVEQQCSSCNFSMMRVHGLSSENALLLIDGQPIFSGLASVYGLDQIPASAIERIEIVKGAGSALYGSSATAGVVNVILREPEKRPYAQLNFDTGEYSSRIGSLVFSQSFGKWAGLISAQSGAYDAVDFNGDQFTDRVYSDNKSLTTRFFLNDVLRPKDRFSFAFNVYDEFRRGGYLPTWDDPFDPDSEHIKTDRKEFGFGYRTRFSDESDLRLNYYHVKHDRNATNGAAYDDLLAYGIVDADYQFIPGVDPDLIRQYQQDRGMPVTGLVDDVRPGAFIADEKMNLFDLAYSRWLGSKHRLTAGMQYKKDDLEESVNKTSNTKSAKEYALFVQDEAEISEKLSLVFGVRNDWHESTDTLTNSSYKESSFNPRVSAKYMSSENIVHRLNLGTGFRVPFLFSEDLHLCASSPRVLKPADLKPETSTSISFDTEWDRGRESWNANLFHIKIDDKLELDVDTPPAGYDATWRNFGSATSKGLELGYKRQVSNFWNVNADYVYTDAEYSDLRYPGEPWSKYVPRSPKHRFNVGVGYSDKSGYSANLTARYTGKMYIDHADATPIVEETDPYWVADLRIAKKNAKSGLTYYLGARNLLDYTQKRRDINDAAYIWAPLVGRVFYGGMKWDY